MITYRPRGFFSGRATLLTYDSEGRTHLTFTEYHERQIIAQELLLSMHYLTYDEAVRIEDLIHSPDHENLTIAEEIIYQKIK